MIEKIVGSPVKVQKDKNQREECGCVESVEIGAYNTCINGCRYCYANDNDEQVRANRALYDVYSPILCSKITEEDKITERVVKSLKEGQISLFFV
jgi:DNA repair photolyase